MLPKLNLQASTLTDINNAMWAGRVVTVHEKTLSYKGWTGDGYSIVDPNTGGGAYLINGGANGGQTLSDTEEGASFILGTFWGGMTGLLAAGVAGALAGSLFIPIFAVVLLAVIFLIFASYLSYMSLKYPNAQVNTRCFVNGFFASLSFSDLGTISTVYSNVALEDVNINQNPCVVGS